MSKYLKGKNNARDEAVKWQAEFSAHNYSYSEVADFQGYFYKKAVRYGLVKEFRENGII